MISSQDTTPHYSILRAIEENSHVHHFRTNIFPNMLAPIFKTDQTQGYCGIFNEVAVTLLRPELYFMFHGKMELAILERGQNTIILTGELIKGNLSFAHMYFQLPNDNPIQEVDTIFCNIRDFFDKPTTKVEVSLSSIDDINEVYTNKVTPLMPKNH